MKNLIGQRFGRLIAIRPTEKRKYGLVLWECACDCGNKVQATSSVLTGGQTKSCGCLRNEHGKKTGEKNRFKYTKDLTGQRFGRLVALSQTDMRKYGNVVWECKCDCGSLTYVASNSLTCGNTRSCGCLRKETAAQIHTFEPLMQAGEQEGVGRKVRKNNTSGYPGIGYRTNQKRYTAEIGFQWYTCYLGIYQNIDDAIGVRKKAEALIRDQGSAFYARWKERAEVDSVWAREHPIRIRVTKDEEQGYSVAFYPEV